MGSDAILVVDKPGGMTSHDVVARIRKVLGTRKVGHAGTLDPMATGVLVLGVGRGTRLLGYLSGAVKEYQATIRLGQTTDTDDADGVILNTYPVSDVTDHDIAAALAQMVGDQDQVPSAVSAIHVEGRRAHERVRAGEIVELAPRKITILGIDVHAITRNEHWIDIACGVTCSSGTYVRAIARDLGAQLGVGGHLVSLRRTRSGGFTSMQPIPESVADCSFMSLADAARLSFPCVELDPEHLHAVSNGVRIAADSGTSSEVHALVSAAGDLVALAEVDGGRWRYRAVFVGSP